MFFVGTQVTEHVKKLGHIDTIDLHLPMEVHHERTTGCHIRPKANLSPARLRNGRKIRLLLISPTLRCLGRELICCHRQPAAHISAAVESAVAAASVI